MPPESTQALQTLEALLAFPASGLVSSLTHACNLVATALKADKVDAFLFDERKATLAAIGTSTQPLSDLQKRLGLDVLPVANGGRVVEVFQTGITFVTGHLENDTDELAGVRDALKVRSQIGVPLDVGGRRRGMMMIASLETERFGADDVRFTELVARWVGMVAHRAELVEELTRRAVEQGRRVAAEELMTVLAHDLRNVLAPLERPAESLARPSPPPGTETGRRGRRRGVECRGTCEPHGRRPARHRAHPAGNVRSQSEPPGADGAGPGRRSRFSRLRGIPSKLRLQWTCSSAATLSGSVNVWRT